jgi:hypothetical protein
VVDRAELAADEVAPIRERHLDRHARRDAQEEVDVGPAILRVAGGGPRDRGAGEPLVRARPCDEIAADLLASLRGEHAGTLRPRVATVVEASRAHLLHRLEDLGVRAVAPVRDRDRDEAADHTHYDISVSPALAPAVTSFLDGPLGADG